MHLRLASQLQCLLGDELAPVLLGDAYERVRAVVTLITRDQLHRHHGQIAIGKGMARRFRVLMVVRTATCTPVTHIAMRLLLFFGLLMLMLSSRGGI